MNYKQYPSSIWSRLENAIANSKAPAVAAFDADGTLWDTDLGETFFQYLIDQKKVALPADPWGHYLQLKKKNNDPREAYLWLAQILKGHSLETVQAWAEEAVADHPEGALPIFEEQKKLITQLRKAGVRVFVVTASVKWAVEPGAARLGLKAEDVIGVETYVENNIVTDRRKGAITYKQGKVDALLAANGGVKPFLASGNTMGDAALLESATDVRLAVSAAARNERLYDTEMELSQLASERGWLAHRFTDEDFIRTKHLREDT